MANTSSPFGYRREAVRVKVMKCEGVLPPEYRKFSVDPQITSFEVLQSILAKAFDIKGDFTVRYRVVDDYKQETYISLLSDWDLDAAFLSSSEPHLDLRVDLKPFSESRECEECWVESSNPEPLPAESRQTRLQGLIMNQVERTFNMVQRALNLVEEQTASFAPAPSSIPPRPPLTDAEFRTFLDPIGQVVRDKELRAVIYFGGIEPSLRKVIWKHILNVYPEGMSGKERMDYMKRKSAEYEKLRDTWREMLKNGQMVGDLAYVTSMVRKDVLRTDRHHVFYAGSDDNKNIAALFNILTTYALNHPAVSYCQGMSDLASPLLVTMNDEAQAYICFCALMRRLAPNFLLDGITMTQRFQHLAEGLMYYDNAFYSYLKSHQADDLLFCYRWLLLEMKREFAFEDALRMLEVMWSSLPPSPPEKEIKLFDQEFLGTPPPPSPRPRENAYTKICALRRQTSGASLSLDEGISLKAKHAKQPKTRPFNSLDEAALEKTQEVEKPPPGRVVKNLNEFLSFDKSGKLKKVNTNAEKKRESEDDGSSPDDSTEYFPMTTSMTRELRLELESLDRHVFGSDKRNPMLGDEVFVWENPLRTATTPDEQTELEMDVTVGEIIETDGSSVKSVTPIRLLKKHESDTTTSSRTESPLDNSLSSDGTSSLLARRKQTLEEINTNVNGNVSSVSRPCDDLNSDISDSVKAKGSNLLPRPDVFGGGNPFLMFLCITVLLQHRDLIMRTGMDYNEMAMHFDKMVRKHDVNKVLNMARQMYASYLKQHSDIQSHLSV
ncbi:TBC1 domain family member 25-like [Macrosteles quadrilineatus]|uniref:TBC1 domain family member 25-like n=1 Tax=Macrosteles quadrilineatus TaxID=74068 RepID=UPI0023E10C25|nr:TBC1 domain family member 25-like [Macrosteles quadrilineatus]XP_054285047.1 TBC1 domain family member 25-like [Macrosteles quadrilineatus]